jgi:4-amino-4-deoxy-L-arabinose transferase-like glycosyltransferase
MDPHTRRERAWIVGGVAGLLALLFLQLAFSARDNSITWDEDDHIYAGYMSWKHADFGLNPEHPPLVKLVAALPLLNLPLKMPALQNRFFKLEAFLGGKDFLFQNDANQMLLRARLAASLFTLFLAVLVFLAAREMIGLGAGFIALALLAFDPNYIAHGAVVGTDMGLSCFMFASVYAFYRYVKAPSAWRIVVVGIAAGLALASKHTGILVFPMLILLALAEIARRDQAPGGPAAALKRNRLWKFAGALVIIAVISVGILWAFYGFRYEARADHLQINPPFASFLNGLSRPRDIHLLSAVGHWRLLPESYLYGLADVRIMSDFYSSYLLGTTYPHGVWFYFPAAIAIKSTLTFLLLLALTIWAIATRRLTGRREILFLTIPPVFHLLVAMGAGMNIGVRHILPVYVFLSVLIAGASWKLIGQNRRWAYVIVALLLFQAVSTLRSYPAYLAYANELWGGPSQSYKLLSDSNTDWGQQLKGTKRYLDQHGVKDCWFVYFAEGVVDAHYYGIPCKPLPTADSLWTNERMDVPAAIDGPVLISGGDLSGFEFGPGTLNPYEQFKTLQPTAVIQYGVFVYDGHFEIPLAASLTHSQKAGDLLTANNFPAALNEAEQAVALAPQDVKANSILGDVLVKLNRNSEARASYERALHLAKTTEPEFRTGWIADLQKKLKDLPE